MYLPDLDRNLKLNAAAAFLYNAVLLLLMLTHQDRIFFYSSILLAIAGVHLLFLLVFAISGMLKMKNLVPLSGSLVTVFAIDFLTWLIIFILF